jgi:RNA polymerase sigma-70 factor (ECF subfamily)
VTDSEIVAALRRNDHAAFDSLFRASYAPLVAVAEGILHNRELAEDQVQEVFLQLWRRRESLQIQESLRSYLFRSVRNRALNHLRHERVVRRTALEVPTPFTPASAPTRLVEEEMEAALRRAVLQLPERCREVFELSRVHGLRNAEVAEVLGISAKTVEGQITKALRLLREHLAPWLTENRP